MLATRDAEPLVEWLQAHPGIEVVVRDRDGAYADAARRRDDRALSYGRKLIGLAILAGTVVSPTPYLEKSQLPRLAGRGPAPAPPPALRWISASPVGTKSW